MKLGMAIGILNKSILELDKDSQNAWIECKKKLCPDDRTISQSNTYWMWIDFLCDYWGYPKTKTWKEYVSNSLKIELGYYVKNKKGIKIPISTADMKKETMRKYMHELQIYLSAEYSINVPLPEDKYFEEFYEAYRM